MTAFLEERLTLSYKYCFISLAIICVPGVSCKQILRWRKQLLSNLKHPVPFIKLSYRTSGQGSKNGQMIFSSINKCGLTDQRNGLYNEGRPAREEPSFWISEVVFPHRQQLSIREKGISAWWQRLNANDITMNSLLKPIEQMVTVLYTQSWTLSSIRSFLQRCISLTVFLPLYYFYLIWVNKLILKNP